MRESTFVNPAAKTEPVRAQHRAVRLRFDAPLLVTVAILLAISLIFVYSASWTIAINQELALTHYLLRQILWIAIGLVCGTIAFIFDYHLVEKFAVWLLLLTITMLIFVAITHFGQTAEGRLGLVGRSGQPSELAKLVIIIYFSVWLNSKREQLSNVTFGLIPMGIILGILIGLIMLNPDISVAITVLVLGGLMFYLADGDARQMFTLIIIALILGYLVITVLQRGSTRWETYLKGLSDPSTADTQIQFAIQSLVNGGLFGVGIGRGVIKHFLPVAWTDSIFAVIVEETGLLGGITIFGLYMVILWRGLSITNHAKDHLGKLLAGGITIWLTGEALVNMLVMANMLPVAGNALPFVSYGGTTIIVAMTAIGLLLNVGLRSSTDATNSEGRSYGAAVDLRWRDGRRRQSRSRRPGSYRE